MGVAGVFVHEEEVGEGAADVDSEPVGHVALPRLG
jgi:hypothetical protein